MYCHFKTFIFSCIVYNILQYYLCLWYNFFFNQVVVPHKSWTGNVAATRLNGCFGELAQVKSAHSPHHYSWSFITFKRQLHWFAPQLHFTSFCTGNSHFYKLLLYQQIIIFKGKHSIWRLIDCLDVTVLAFTLELYAVPHLWNILHRIFPTWCWDNQALPTKHFIIWGFRIKDSLKAHLGDYKLVLLKVWVEFTFCDCVWTWKF